VEEKAIYKTCNVCGESKPLTEFHRSKNGKFGRYSACKKCKLKYKKQYYQEHKEKSRIYRKRYDQEHKEQKAKYNKEYHQNNKNQIQKRKKEYYKTENGAFINRRNSHRRRVRERATDTDLTPDQWQRILASQRFMCNLCGRKFTKNRLATIDHIIPLSEGGDLTSSNIQALCQSCNSSKHAKILKSFINSWCL
jgi:5-methylcytosine-specific restriction endonuclease McrA